MSMMSDYEEDLDDFPVANKDRLAESMVGSCRAESTDQYTARGGITTKIPPLFGGSTSWFKCEELIDDWLDLTVLEAGKRGPALKNRLVGDAELYRGLLNREPLRAADGVKYFRNTLRPHFHQMSSECVLLEILSIHSSEKRTRRTSQVNRKVSLAFEALEGCLDGHVTVVHHERRAKTKPVSCRRDSGEC